METETLDKLYLEWSQFTKAETRKEIELKAENAKLREVARDVIAMGGDFLGGLSSALEDREK